MTRDKRTWVIFWGLYSIMLGAGTWAVLNPLISDTRIIWFVFSLVLINGVLVFFMLLSLKDPEVKNERK